MEKLAYRIDEACEVAGLGVATLYRERDAGRIHFVKRGRRTLILAEELKRYLDTLPAFRKPGARP